ncbi:MAG TPA: hypothetical protein VMP68_00210 [Candidatus Eisenbacteria bacterium]|nr:hypothetical protein [Candidatus Eisenbacteria bacterium]
MSGALFSTVFKLGYQISPIIMTGGLAANIPGQMLPLITITEGASILTGLLSGSFPTSLDDFFANFTVIPGSNLISQQVGHYPFANQSVAANAVITQPLTVSVRMDCPAKSSGAYVSKVATLTALQAALSAHNASGGLYTVATPGFIYTNLVMTALTDISGAGSNQVQYQYQFDFEQPLVTLAAGQQAYSALLNKIASGTQITGAPTWSGLATSVGSQISNAASSVVQGASNLIGLNSVASPVTTITQTPLS